MSTRIRATVTVLLLIVIALTPPLQTSAGASSSPPSAGGASPLWRWPIDAPRAVASPYRAPAHAFGAGHRGIDLASAHGVIVRAPADGVIAFRGVVVDRPLITIAHPGGYVSTFEPASSALAPGDTVSAGDEIGTVAAGGHASLGALHLGVRLDGAYINPMLLFGPVPRAVLLPCCDAP
ncbi:M23 family metallopeptidase [Microbacterium sp. APC 3901]|uniref:M23 family metallopeptidase n=1 Tax=Microbacterium sp. APC 3901 TaxID=3035192 RepID=UPI0025B505D0|nr:M23 family metallopeptidase [Microbacterium sp. APC 3901]MDN3444500.1 M23 family metallopeptidase [Microbacterium sp. APC 3901]